MERREEKVEDIEKRKVDGTGSLKRQEWKDREHRRAGNLTTQRGAGISLGSKGRWQRYAHAGELAGGVA